MTAYREIVVGARTQFVVKVSPEDYDFLMQWRWTFARSHGQWSGLIYARRSIHEPSGNRTILMHRVIIVERMGLERPSEQHFVVHDNGDSLDNRRVNDRQRPQLAWLTNAENMAKRKHTTGKIAVPLPPESGLAEIPY
jgi:hypothetical protein